MSDKNDIVIINLGRPRVLRFGHKALKMLGAMTGKDVDAAIDMDKLDLEVLEKIMYCGLLRDAKENGEDLKLEDMEDLLDSVSFAEITNKLQEALNTSFGVFAGEEKN
jgi:hypothetical protein